MWGSTLWQKFVICFTITFFTIWISTLATWTTILAARQEGQGAQSAPFSKVACGVLQDEAKVKATKTAPKGSAWQDGITMTADSKWRPTLFGRVQTGTASVNDVELQTACPGWNRDGALFVKNKLISYSNSRGLTENYNGIRGYPSDNLADFTIADCNNVPQFVLKFFATATTKYNVPESAALVIKNASSCTMSPCDFESASYPTVAYATPVDGFNDPATKFWQGGKAGTIIIKDMSKSAVANLQISVVSPQTIGAELVGNYDAIGLALDHLLIIGGKGIWTDGGKYYFTNPRDMDYKSYNGGCMNTYLGSFVSSWVFLAFFIAIIIFMLVVCLAQRCCGKKAAAAGASGGATAVEMDGPAKPPVPVRMN